MSAHWDVHKTFQAVSYGLVATAFLPIALSGEVGQVAPLAFAAAAIVSLFRDPRLSPPRPQTAKLWTAVVLVAFAVLITWSLQDGNWLLHALEFALLLTASRLFQRRFAKDHLQLLGLSFILLLVAAIVQPGPLFALCFLAYAVMVMWGLSLLHLTRQIEVQTETGPEHLLPPAAPKRRWLGLLPAKPLEPKTVWPELPVHASTVQWRSRRLLGPRYFLVTTLLSLAVLAGSALFFLLFPRLGMGFFFAQTRAAKSVIGFSTDAELGQFGALKSNAEVVARVTFPDNPERLQQPLRLRGVSFDTFAGNGWTRPTTEPWPLRGSSGVIRLPRVEEPDPKRENSWRAELYLEPLDRKQRVLFTPPDTWSVEMLDTRFDYLRGRKKSVLRAQNGDLSYVAPPDTALHYAVQVKEVTDIVADAKQLREASTQLPADLRDRYTQLPADLDPRIAQLATKLAGNSSTWFDQAFAIERGLRAGWTYSLAGDQDAKAPLADFLFGVKHGHCEFFATSMALLLRTRGIPARTVHGFAGGSINPIGNYRMVRQGDAHAWVEVYFPKIGWRTFDPTPPSGQTAPPDEGIGQQLRQLVDSASLIWYQWVVEYDLDRQAEMLKSLGGVLKNLRGDKSMAKWLGQGGGKQEEVGKTATETHLPGWLWPAAGAVALLAGLWWWRWGRRSGQGAPLDAAVDRGTHRLQVALARQGWQRQPHETWHGVARRLATETSQLSLLLGQFATAYDQARYSGAGFQPYRTQLVELVRQATSEAQRIDRERRRKPARGGPT